MRSKIQGFTLIELMITVAIVAILASIAVPSYRNYVMRSQRTVATTALLRIQSAEEKFFLQNNAYTGNLVGAPPAGLGMSNATDDGRYGLGVALVGNGYLATATAAGSQLDDTKCQTFTINQGGTRGATGSATNPTQECWR